MTTGPLSPEDFDQFFRELNHPHDPFPWQSMLAREVCDSGWPKSLDLPTAAGKTAVLDIAVFHLALEATQGAARRAPLRIAFVVDRRLIVDQAETRATQIAAKLRDAAPGTIMGMVAERLRLLAGGSNPALCVAKLRGGIPLETDWARTPVQPTILLSTVDQVGSRILFRGYGVSDSMKPVHAGLLGSDCLIFLDEAHLSEPFRQTLEWIDFYRKEPWSEARSGPWNAVNLSATPGQPGNSFQLCSKDLEHPVLKARIEASKPAQLIEIDHGDAAKTYADQARRLRDEHETRKKVLIVVNRVDLARQVFNQFSNEEGRILLIGRARDADRERVAELLLARLDRESDPNPAVVVSTQCIEAGADVDFDVLVTQLAPLDSLKQRFGRLNRRGREVSAAAAILATKDDRKPKRLDPVYGSRSQTTWELLMGIASTGGKMKVVDFGISAIDSALRGKDEMVQKASTEKADAPVVPPAYIDLWAMTSPLPAVDPEVALFLHGPERASADVEVVWRADVKLEWGGDFLRELIATVPPQRREVLSMPIWKVQAWLAQNKEIASHVSDMEGETEPDPVPAGSQVFRWSGEDNERTGIVEANKLRPGDLIVVPASFGGCDRWGWSPGSGPVQDVVDPERFGRLTVRFHRGYLPSPESDATWNYIQQKIESCEEDAEALAESLREWAELPGRWKEPLQAMRPSTARLLMSYPDGGVILSGKPERAELPSKLKLACSTETDSTGSLTESGHSLKNHTAGVLEKTSSFVKAAGLNQHTAQSIQLAAELHDLGKGDRRFQAYLYGSAPGARVLAKSKRGWLGPARERQIRAASNLPGRWRHEALSVRLALQDPRLADDSKLPIDRELVLWLIGTHHGYGRPFFPHDDPADDVTRHVCDEDGEPVNLAVQPGPQRADFDWCGSDWASLFEVLRRRYGAWELARLEAILRLADHRASEEENE